MKRNLIAEDEARIASFVDKGLRSNGFTPSLVGDGQTADDYAVSGDFDLLVLDIGLPRLDGFTVQRKMRAARNLAVESSLSPFDSPDAAAVEPAPRALAPAADSPTPRREAPVESASSPRSAQSAASPT